MVGAVLFLVIEYGYLIWEEKRLKAAGEHFTFPEGKDLSAYQVDRNQLPPALQSFIPMIVVVGMIVGLRGVITNSSALVVLAMLVASAIAIAFNWNRFSDKMALVNAGTSGAITAIAGPCAVVAFGTLVQNTPSFQMIVNWVLSFDMNIYVTAGLSTAIISGITGSSSGGLRITMQTLSEQYIASGANLEIIHRLSSIFAGSLDSLPHSSALFLMFSYLGITHKEGYRFVGFTSVVIPCIIGIILTIGVIAIGL